MDIKVTVGDEEYALLVKLASDNKVTLESYASNIVSGWATSQLKGAYIQYVAKTSLTTLKEKLGTMTMEVK